MEVEAVRAGCPQRVGGLGCGQAARSELEALWWLRPCGQAAHSELEALWRLSVEAVRAGCPQRVGGFVEVEALRMCAW